MNWHNIYKEPLPKTNKDMDILIKAINVPMYISAVWDGKLLHIYSGYDDAPWKPFPDYVTITDWAEIN